MSQKSESGQSLLVIVLLISVVFTLIATASYRLTTETQTTRLQEESLKTLAGADSGIERGIRLANTTADTTTTFLGLNLTLPGIDAMKSTLTITSDTASNFVSPVITRDEQFTYYLYQYPDDVADIITQDINILFFPTTCSGLPSNHPAVEITLIYGTTGSNIQHWLADPCAVIGGVATTKLPVTAINTTLQGTTFRYQVTIDLATTYTTQSPKLLIVRPVGGTSTLSYRFGFRVPSGKLFSQGQTIRSEAVSINGISKIVTLFKSYPQIPADFFVTRF